MNNQETAALNKIIELYCTVASQHPHTVYGKKAKTEMISLQLEFKQ